MQPHLAVPGRQQQDIRLGNRVLTASRWKLKSSVLIRPLIATPAQGRVPDRTRLERISIISGCVIGARPAATCQPHAVVRRRAAGDVDVDRNDTVATTHHRIRIVIIAAAVGHEPMEIT